MNGENIKVHFAGTERSVEANIALKIADVKYRLYSCYAYIHNKAIDGDFKLKPNNAILLQQEYSKHVIQDSGLFTLMFGAKAGQKFDLDFLVSWQDKLIKFVLDNNITATYVEIDCQKILGTEEAWFLRKRMRDLLPNKQINVFHFEDGRDGLNKLINFSNYIAISVPELRRIRPREYKKDVSQLARYIKKKKPSIDIHLLGCTEVDLLAENYFCTSSDSTSWLQLVQWGTYKDVSGERHVVTLKDSLMKEAIRDVKRIRSELGIEMTEKAVERTAQLSIAAKICKKKYQEAAGHQD